MSDQLPWEVCPELQRERLQLIAENLRDVRHDALEIHDKDKGDDGQVHGTIAYVRSCKRIMQMSELPGNSWMKIVDPSRRFIFSVGGIPMRMYRGDSRRPPERSLRSYVAELEARQDELPFGDLPVGARPGGWVWRMAIETDDEGRVIRVVVFEANRARQVRNPYEIPMRNVITEMTRVAEVERPGKELPAAPVGKKKPTQQDEADQRKAQESGGGEVVPFKKNDPSDGKE